MEFWDNLHSQLEAKVDSGEIEQDDFAHQKALIESLQMAIEADRLESIDELFIGLDQSLVKQVKNHINHSKNKTKKSAAPKSGEVIPQDFNSKEIENIITKAIKSLKEDLGSKKDEPNFEPIIQAIKDEIKKATKQEIDVSKLSESIIKVMTSSLDKLFLEYVEKLNGLHQGTQKFVHDFNYNASSLSGKLGTLKTTSFLKTWVIPILVGIIASLSTGAFGAFFAQKNISELKGMQQKTNYYDNLKYRYDNVWDNNQKKAFEALMK